MAFSGSRVALSLFAINLGASPFTIGVRTLLVSISQTTIPLLFGALGAVLGMMPVFWTMAALLVGGGYVLRKP